VPLFQDRGRKKSTGLVQFLRLRFCPRRTFYEYIKSGIELNLITAIDFTESNGIPDLPTSLHFIQGSTLNPYEACIHAVGSVVCPYDSDQLFPVYGFGAVVGPEVSHCFPLTFTDNPNVRGLEGILAAYRSAVERVLLCGPTNFAPVISVATKLAIDGFMRSRTYTILMIVTDGALDDMQPTIDAIVDGSDAPLSVLIVGVGNASFEAMAALDADMEPLMSSRKRPCKRDIVQFVPFAKYAADPTRLAAELLAEIPSQLEAFCATQGVRIDP
jgi:hypothetical protein